MIRLELKKWLRKRGKSIYRLSKDTGMTEKALTELMNGESQGIRYKTLERLCEVLECEPGDLLVRVKDGERKDYSKSG